MIWIDLFYVYGVHPRQWISLPEAPSFTASPREKSFHHSELLLKMAIEIVDLSMKNRDFSHS